MILKIVLISVNSSIIRLPLSNTCMFLSCDSYDVTIFYVYDVFEVLYLNCEIYEIYDPGSGVQALG